MASHDLFEHKLGAVVSGLPLLNFSPKKVTAILTAAFSKLRDGGSFYQFTYGMQCPVSKAQLDELRADAYRLEELRTELNDQLQQLVSLLDRAEERNEQLKSTAAVK
jgi:phospholipid N-methyltransferase